MSRSFDDPIEAVGDANLHRRSFAANTRLRMTATRKALRAGPSAERKWLIFNTFPGLTGLCEKLEV